jgi:hypothetical protein
MLRAPWKAIPGKSNYRFEVEDDEGFTVARIVGGHMDGGQAKATLIAAAPSLFVALDRLVKASGQIGLLDNHVEDARRAAIDVLAKAGAL